MDIPVLIIEDNPDHQALAQMHLNADGIHDVEIVGSIQAGLHACGERARQVIVVDSGVVSAEGRKAIGRLRECSPGARIIGYSAGARAEDWADAHFIKGDFEDLLSEIRKGPVAPAS